MGSLWGPFDLATGQAAQWTIGGALLWLERREGFIQVGTAPSTDHGLAEVSVELPLSSAAPPEGISLRRLALPKADVQLWLEPEYPDRPVVARADAPMLVPPGVSVLAYVSVPLWVRVGIGATSLDIPLLRPLDTWFGGPTVDDGLGYASRTAMRLDLDSVPERVHRVVVSVRITNAGEDMLEVTRLRIPVGRLHLFESGGGGLWSNLLHFLREESSGSARVTIETGPPPDRPKARPVATPRLTDEFNPVQRAFAALLR